MSSTPLEHRRQGPRGPLAASVAVHRGPASSEASTRTADQWVTRCTSTSHEPSSPIGATRYIAEAETHRIARRDIAKYRRPSFVLRLVRRMSRARRAAPVTVSIASAATPKITAPTT